MNQNNGSQNEDQSKQHPFTRTLGLGPYHFVDFFALSLPSEANQGRNNFHLAPKVERGIGTCAHCGHAIVNCYIVQIGDGRRFGVGSDCIEKCGLPYQELTKVQKFVKARQKEQRKTLKASKGQAARLELSQLVESQADLLKSIELYSPQSTIQQKVYDYAVWCLTHSNDGGIVIVLKKVKLFLQKASK